MSHPFTSPPFRCVLISGFLTAGLLITATRCTASASDCSTRYLQPHACLAIVMIDTTDRSATVLSAARREVERLLEPADISVLWLEPHRSDLGDFVHPPVLIKVLISAQGPSHHKTDPRSLAHTVRERPSRAPSNTAFVSMRALVELLGRPREAAIRPVDFGRALGRIITHELAHLMVPDASHSEDGLMASHLSREQLLGQRLELEEPWLTSIRRGLKARAELLMRAPAGGDPFARSDDASPTR